MTNEHRIAKAIGTFIGNISVDYFLVGFFIWVVWNAIASQFSLPQFNYWVCVAAAGILHICKGATHKTSSHED